MALDAALSMDLLVSPLIGVTSLSFRYPRQAAALFEEASFSIQPGTITALVGPNGCGKSTLLDILAGATIPSSGSIASRLDAREVGYVPQNPVAFGNLRYEEAVTMARALAGVADATLEGLKSCVAPRWRSDIERLRHRFIAQLSGGERQWLYLMLTLASPRLRLWLLDEPLTSLDDEHKDGLREMIAAGRDEGKAALIAVHDLGELADLCERRIRIDACRIVVQDEEPGVAVMPRVMEARRA